MTPRLFVTITLVLVQGLAVCTADTRGSRFTLVIDAGHGGHDAGAIGTYSKEKNINLNVALAFGKLVEQNCSDVKVIYTRKTDVFVPLQERAAIANRSKADLFISVHTNALPGGRIAYGPETYTLGMARSSENFDVAKRENSVILVENDYKEKYAGFNPNSSESYIIFEFMQDVHMKQSISLAQSIQKHYVDIAGRKNKGVHQAGFLVLRETSMPSVLTELGFISTPEEEAYLNSQNGINKLSRAIYEGFLDYKHSQDGKLRPATNYEDTEMPSPAEQSEEKAPARQGETAGIQAQEGSADTLGGSVLAQHAGNASPEPEEDTKEDTKADTKENIKEDIGAAGSGTQKAAAGQKEDAGQYASGKPVFKIQFTTSDVKLKPGDRRLHGFDDADFYRENGSGILKYTCKPTSDYSEAVKNQKEVRKTVPDAFIVAFKNGRRMNLADAISEYKSNKSK